jgi:DNA-binding XRE family transcriptional regulator
VIIRRNRLKKIRLERRIRQHEISRKIHTWPQTISKIENHAWPATQKQKKGIAKFFKLRIEDIFPNG